MSKKVYSARYNYQSPNIIIVPTVSFNPPPARGTKQITNTSTPISLVKGNIGVPSASISPCHSNCSQRNLQITSSNTITSTQISDNFINSLCTMQDMKSTEAPAFNTNQSIQDVSTTKYISRNNLVDLTGFNLLKREKVPTYLAPLSKPKDLRQIDDTKIEQDNIKTSYDKNESLHKTDNISKESLTSVKPTHNQGNTENVANSEAKESKPDMEDKMKTYFSHLWKRSFEKLKEKVAKAKQGRPIKSSSRTKEDYKDSKQESSRSKANLHKVTKSISSGDLRNKIKDSAKKHRDLERRVMAKRSKNETNFSHLPGSKVSEDRKLDSSPDSLKRYKDFLQSIRHKNDQEIKYKSRNELKTDNLPRRKIRMKSCETTTNNPVIKKKVDERKQSIKIEKRSKVNTNQTNLKRVETYTDTERNTDRVKLIKSVVVDKNVHNNLSQSKRGKSCSPLEVQDLRTRLSRKRANTEYYVNHREPMENRLDQENHMIIVKQEVNANSKNSRILAPIANKPKPKKCKKIKLTIHINCPSSDSDYSDQDFNETCSSSEDLSFLDELNVDEIVDLLNESQVEPNKPINTDRDYKNNQQIKHEENLINNAKMRTINITEKEETNQYEEQVIRINSDTEDTNIEIGYVAKQEPINITDLTGKGYGKNVPKEIIDLCKDEEIIEINSKVDKHTKQNNLGDLNGKYYNNCAPKETLNLQDDSNDSVVEVIDITDENEHDVISKHCQPEEPIQTWSAYKANLDITKSQLFKQSNKPIIKRITGLENTNNKSHITQHEDKQPPITAKQTSDPTNITDKKQTQLQKNEDPIEASLQEMFDIEKNKSVNGLGVKTDVSEQLNTLDKHVEEKNDNSSNSEGTFEALLESMKKICEQNASINKHIKQNKINECVKKAKDSPKQTPLDAMEASIETKFNGTKHQDTGINRLNSGQHIQKEINAKQRAQVMIKVPLKSVRNIMDQKKNLKVIKNELSNKTDNRIKIDSESQIVNQILPEIAKHSIEQNTEIKINSEPLNFADIKENRPSKNELLCDFGNSAKGALETAKKIADNSLTNDNTQCEPLQKSVKTIKTSNVEHANSTKGPLEAKSFAENSLTSPQIDIKPQRCLSQNNDNIKGEPLQKSVKTIKTSNGEQDSESSTKGPLEAKGFAENSLTSPQIDIKPQSSLSQDNNNTKCKPSQKSVKTIKTSNGKQDFRNSTKGPLETAKSFAENSMTSPQIDVKQQSKTKKQQSSVSQNNNNSKGEPSQKSVETIQTSSNGERDFGNSTKGTLETAKSFAENNLTSPQIDIKPQSSLSQNNDNTKCETLQKSVKTIQTSSNGEQDFGNSNKGPLETAKSFAENSLTSQIDIKQQSSLSENNDNTKAEPLKSVETSSNCEQKTNITSDSNKPDKDLVENVKARSEVVVRSNIQHKTNTSTSVEITNPSNAKAGISLTAKNIETQTKKKNKKSNIKNKTKSDTVKNKAQKLENIYKNKISIKDSKLGKTSKIVTNTKTKEKQIVSNKSLVQNKNNDKNKSYMDTTKVLQGMGPFISTLESQMSHNLQKKCIFSSIIRDGQFSTIYKFEDTIGGVCAVKVCKYPEVGLFLGDMLYQLQKYSPRQDYFVIYLLNAFEVQNKYCLLTEYYPENLNTALYGRKNGFHLNQVQILSRQLVDAVNMLTDMGIIHSDINPSHILLNGEHNRLKLCGFDCANFSECFNVSLSPGTLSYRAPEVIIGFQIGHRIDVWATALVMFRMATNQTLITGDSNSDVLYQQLCTFGSLEWAVLEQSRFAESYFTGTTFVRWRNENSQKICVAQPLKRNDNLRVPLYRVHKQPWSRNVWSNNAMSKLESFHALLQEMLVMDPRNRMHIQFVAASRFMNHL